MSQFDQATKLHFHDSHWWLARGLCPETIYCRSFTMSRKLDSQTRASVEEGGKCPNGNIKEWQRGERTWLRHEQKQSNITTKSQKISRWRGIWVQRVEIYRDSERLSRFVDLHCQRKIWNSNQRFANGLGQRGRLAVNFDLFISHDIHGCPLTEMVTFIAQSMKNNDSCDLTKIYSVAVSEQPPIIN